MIQLCVGGDYWKIRFSLQQPVTWIVWITSFSLPLIATRELCFHVPKTSSVFFTDLVDDRLSVKKHSRPQIFSINTTPFNVVQLSHDRLDESHGSLVARNISHPISFSSPQVVGCRYINWIVMHFKLQFW